MKKISDSEFRKHVADFYSKIAKGESSVEVNPIGLAESLGYSEDDLKNIPLEANLGLGCSNPLKDAVINEGETLLDLGSGAGMDCFLARIKFPKAGLIIGIDRDKNMIARAQSTLQKKGFSNMEFRQGELTKLPVESESVDVIISNCVINLVPEKDKVYSEIYRVLKKGGRIFISDISLKKELTDEMKSDPALCGT